MKMFGGPDPLFVRARRALLDALDALGPHRRAAILVGAQAVYLHVGEAREPLASFTIDADLVINPATLPDSPALHLALSGAGFQRREQPGLWFTRDGVEVDLLVPASLAGTGRRGVDLGPNHERTTAMRAAGLEAALIDHAPRLLTSLDPDDQRRYTLSVAGPAALLIAKLHKIGERSERSPDRLKAKDASDLFLLLRATETGSFVTTIRQLLEHPQARETAETALQYLRLLFTSEMGAGITLLRQAVEGIEDEATVALSCIALVDDLLDALA